MQAGMKLKSFGSVMDCGNYLGEREEEMLHRKQPDNRGNPPHLHSGFMVRERNLERTCLDQAVKRVAGSFVLSDLHESVSVAL